MSQGIDPDSLEVSMYDVLVHDISIREVIRKREVDVACASIDLAGAEIAMSTQIGRERSLQKAFAPIKEDYDFICIDTPPSLGLLTINALTASDKVIVPVQCEYLSMRGLIQLQNTLSMIRENLNPDVEIEGILPTLVDIAHRPREGGDRDPRGELRRPRLRLADHQDGALRGGAREGDVGAQVRPGRQGRIRLPSAGEGGPLEWQRGKRASMREGPLAALFRKTEEEGRRAEPPARGGTRGQRAAREAEPRARSASAPARPARPREQPRRERRRPSRRAEPRSRYEGVRTPEERLRTSSPRTSPRTSWSAPAEPPPLRAAVASASRVHQPSSPAACTSRSCASSASAAPASTPSTA